MNELGIRFRRFRYNFRHDFLTVANVVLMIAIFFCLFCTYRSIESMNRNWELSENLHSAKKTLELKKIEIEMAELENEYYETDEYKELAARKFANKQLEGENMVYMPENTDEARNKHMNDLTAATDEKKEYSNFEKWMMYLWP